jgi:hypothetical protein
MEYSCHNAITKHDCSNGIQSQLVYYNYNFAFCHCLERKILNNFIQKIFGENVLIFSILNFQNFYCFSLHIIFKKKSQTTIF